MSTHARKERPSLGPTLKTNTVGVLGSGPTPAGGGLCPAEWSLVGTSLGASCKTLLIHAISVYDSKNQIENMLGAGVVGAGIGVPTVEDAKDPLNCLSLCMD